jgi:gliding motility-associated-like protein
MRNYLLFFFCAVFFLSFLSSVKAQYVSIPDANFRAYLETTFPTCMQGGMMDTTCTNIVNATTIDVHSKNISDLTGIQYFDRLEQLYCYDNNLTYLPSLPNTLIKLDCVTNKLSSLPALPALLRELDCGENQLTFLPPLPSSLAFLECERNALTSLPTLPISLIGLMCSNNQLQTLPPLPDLLKDLWCWDNQLTVLPALSVSMQTLLCDSNHLKQLPTLPPSLISLVCRFNELTALPDLPASLNGLVCSFNELTVLPYLPTSLTSLSCNNNQLTVLPYLPQNLGHLSCYLNQITCLPVLPNSLTNLVTDTLCRPNRPASLKNDYPQNSPLCSALTFTNTRVCAGDSTSFDLKDASCHAFMWDFDDPVTGAYNTSTLPNPKHLFSHPGTFNVKLISYVSNPATVITQVVTVDKLSRIDFGNDHSMCPDDGIVLDAGPGFISYLWQDGSTSQTYAVKTAGTYTVTATNACGSATETIHLSDYILTVPNLFTPNKDGHNDTFEIKGLNGDAGSLHVYNSWGGEIYGSEKYYNNWNAEELTNGIYYYSFSLKSCPVQKGWLQIIR